MENLQSLQDLLQNGTVRKRYYERITFRIPSTVKKILEEHAKERGMTISDLIRIYIWLGLKHEFWDDRK
jgi:hypothetical protein